MTHNFECFISVLGQIS